MYRDNTLIPTEAVRLAALGSLAECDKPHHELTSELRYFIARMIGPSLDLLGTSLDLMFYEGLIAIADGKGDHLVGTQGIDGTTVLKISTEGFNIFKELMSANVRAPVNDVTRLVVALKLRFLPLLSEAERSDQLEALAEMCEHELARLRDLKVAYGSGLLGRWLNDEIDTLTERQAMFTSLQKVV